MDVRIQNAMLQEAIYRTTSTHAPYGGRNAYILSQTTCNLLLFVTQRSDEIHFTKRATALYKGGFYLIFS